MTGSVWKVGGLAAIFAVSALSAGCGDGLTALDCHRELRQSTFMSQAEGIPEEYEGLPVYPSLVHLLTTAPPDSVVKVSVELRVPQQDFVQIVEELGGEVVYLFMTFNAVTINITVAGLDVIVRRPELYTHISIGSGSGSPAAPVRGCR